MDYYTDRPIESKEQDLLGRSAFCNQIGKAIYEYKGKEGLVIGFFGKWGTGKTSVINMAINEITKQASAYDNQPIIMRFAPWNYTGKDNLIGIFFQNMKNKLEIQNDSKLSKIGDIIEDYSATLDTLSSIPVVGRGASFVKALANRKKARNSDLDLTR